MTDSVNKSISSTTNGLLKTLFSLSSLYPLANIKVIAISNSLDLTSRRSMASTLGNQVPDTLAFQSYGAKEMLDVVKARVDAVAATAPEGSDKPVEVDPKAIELVGRKVEASNGDLRMCLSVMVEAVGMAEAEWRRKKSAAGQGFEVAKPKVSLPHVLKALASFNKLRGSSAAAGNVSGQSPGNGLVAKVKSLSLQVRVILLSLLVARQRHALGLRPVQATVSSLYGPGSAAQTTSGHISPESLYPTYTHILNHDSSPISPASQTDFMDLMMQVEVMGVLAIESAGSSPVKLGASKAKGRGGKGKERTIELLMREEDLKLALGLNALADGNVDATNSEVRTMWNREEAKWTKASEYKQRNAEEVRRKAQQGPLGFDDEN